uniref:TMEM131_like domain-containing protein n=1 Tax=Angiostrongylus cantonensis TaxID=6313 RepID=A0A158PAD6_ANGCA
MLQFCCCFFQVLTLQTISTPVEVRLKANTGVRLLHHSSALITSSNLSFIANVPDLPLSFSIVGVPHHGVIECSPNDGHFTVCSTFSQEQIDRGLVRFRHTSAHHPTQDTFSFQVFILSNSSGFIRHELDGLVESGGFVSMIHNFRLMFIPMNVKVFNREVFMLNGTESGTLSRSNLFAWTFPKGYPPEKLIYHIEEPPKYGILSRKINGKSRRIGVSSNFTQADIDNELISFKLHFMQYSIINDFFLFRVVTPAISSESLRFEIIFVPTQTSIQLVNRTVVVQEGETSVVGSDSLSLATPDDSFFVFTLTFAPINGSLVLRTRTGNKTLTTGMNFTTKDIAEERLLYSHSGSESRTDQLHLIAESAFRKGRRIPFWMSFSIIPVNDNRPHLRGSHIIQIVERGERILYPHLLDWVDDDSDGVPLQFNFYQPIKDAAVLSTVSPYLPVTLFSEQDLRQGRVMLRHLGHKNNFTVRYSEKSKHSIHERLQWTLSILCSRCSLLRIARRLWRCQ